MRKKDLNLPEEPFRLEVKELAETVRTIYARKGLSDIFDILSEAALLIRKPLVTDELSGFTTYIDEEFIVFLNSRFTLGHERFTGAHELYHLTYNADILKRETIIPDDEKYKSEDEKANIFAAELLMPEDYVKEVFYKIVNVDKDSVLPRHIIRMHNFFKVSYKAMLKRLIQLDLCSLDRYDELVENCARGNEELLKSLTRQEGYDIDLIVPSKVTYVPREYIEFIRTNYERGNISYKNMKNCLEFIGFSPKTFGYQEPLEEEFLE